MKNSQKISFDFIITMDRFLEKHKEKQKKIEPLVIKLWEKKN